MKDKEPVNNITTEDAGKMSEDEIDMNLEDTFPASDPPSWTLGINHHEVPLAENEEEDEGEDSLH